MAETPQDIGHLILSKHDETTRNCGVKSFLTTPAAWVLTLGATCILPVTNRRAACESVALRDGVTAINEGISLARREPSNNIERNMIMIG